MQVLSAYAIVGLESTEYLFPGQTPTRPITARAVHLACRDTREASGIGKRVTVHTLRHGGTAARCREMVSVLFDPAPAPGTWMPRNGVMP